MRANPTEWSVSRAACSCGDPRHHEGFDLIATDHGASRVYRRYRTEAAARQALRRMAGASSAAWHCTGRGPGSASRCRRTFRSRTSAIRHFEKTGHDVEGPNPRKGRRPAARQKARHNPPRGRAVLIYPEGRVVGTWFGTHRNGGHYKHRFTHRAAAIYGNRDGSITIRAHKGRLWAMFR